MDKSNPIVISIEGLIGSGKSTLINECLVPCLTNKGYRVTVIKEPVDLWGEILPLFYTDPSRWAYTFQSIAFLDRINEARDMWGKHKEITDIFITERSIVSDKLFVETLYKLGSITDMEYHYYYKWCKLWTELLPFKPDLFVYLCPSIDTIMGRVKIRARKGEEGVSKDYQLLLRHEHDLMFGSDTTTDNIKVLQLNIDSNFKDDITIQDNITNLIIQNI